MHGCHTCGTAWSDTFELTAQFAKLCEGDASVVANGVQTYVQTVLLQFMYTRLACYVCYKGQEAGCLDI